MAAWDLGVRLVGERVALEPMRSNHEDDLYAISRDPELFRWWPWDLSASREAVHGYIQDCLRCSRDGERQHYLTLDARTGEPIGSTSYCMIDAPDRTLEIGATFLVPDRWGGGENVEAKLLMLRHAFEACGCQRVQIVTDALNERSRAAILALGAQFEGIHRQDRLIAHSGRIRDSAFYSIIDSEWPAVEQRLVGRLAAKSAS
jgi:RimJ/RimL family protein N-acetyltransferase